MNLWKTQQTRQRAGARLAALMLAASAVQPAAAQADRLEVQLVSGPASALSVENVKFKKVGALTRLALSVTNSGSSGRFEYTFEWKDEDGFIIKSVAGWQTLFLDSGATKDISSVGKQPGAYSARMKIR